MNREREIHYEPHPVSPTRKAELVAQGYRIIDAKYRPVTEEPPGNTPPPQTVDPHKLGTAALKAELAARRIEVPQGAKKADLVALLEAALAAEGPGHD
ncbi:MAG: hypothetical protein Q4A62_03475 [Eikenella sp.]|nr:hypothetical protein [Eikenella sp.]